MLRSSATVRLAARAACAATWPPNSRGRRDVAARVQPAEDVAVELLEVEHLEQLGDVAGLGFAPLHRIRCFRRVVHAGNRRPTRHRSLRCLSWTGWQEVESNVRARCYDRSGAVSSSWARV